MFFFGLYDFVYITHYIPITAGGELFCEDNWMVGVDWAWGNFRYSS